MAKVKLGDVSKESKKVFTGDRMSCKVVGLEHLTPEDVVLHDWDENVENTFTKAFSKGQVLFGRRRAYLKKAVVAPFDGVCSGDITVIEAIEGKIVPELLPFIIQNDSLFEYAVGKSAGSLSPRVKWEHLKNYEFELPEIDKQRKLAEILWASVVAREKYKKAIESTDALVKSQFIEMFGDPIENDRRWKQDLLGNTLQIERGGSPRPISAYTTESEDGINWIKIGDADASSRYIYSVNEKIIPAGLSKTRRVFEGDVLLSNSMSFGKPYILKVNGCIHDGWLVLHDDNNAYDKVFLCIALGLDCVYRVMRMLAAGGVVSNLNKELVSSIPFIVPPLSLQRTFAEFVEQSDKLKFTLQQRLENLEKSYKALLQKQFPE